MEEVIQIQPTGLFKPPLVQGDREFFGNGPQVDVSAQIYVVRSKFFLKFAASFQEVGGGKASDNTRFAGSETREIYDLALTHPGKTFRSIKTSTFDQLGYLDVTTRVDTYDRGANGLINKIEIQGDIQGADDPWVKITFNPMVIEISD